MEKLSKKETEALKLIHGQINIAFKVLETHLEEVAKKWGTTSIPLGYIKTAIDNIKKGINEGSRQVVMKKNSE